MNATCDSREAWDRLVLLLIAQPRQGWEDVYEEITRREVERLAPLPEQVKRPTADPEQVGRRDGTEVKGDSASETIIPKVY